MTVPIRGTTNALSRQRKTANTVIHGIQPINPRRTMCGRTIGPKWMRTAKFRTDDKSACARCVAAVGRMGGA